MGVDPERGFKLVSTDIISYCLIYLEERSIMDRKNPQIISFLPDEIISDILIRVPAKTVMRCRLVCKRFRDLTLTPQFVKSHSEINTTFPPSIIVAPFEVSLPALNLIALDNWWKDTVQMSGFDFYFGNGNGNFRVTLSHSGLIVFEEVLRLFKTQRFIIFNPIRPMDEVVTITISKHLILGCMIFGVYYHPSLKQYCTLLKIRSIEYGVLNLGSNPSFKKITNPFSHREKKPDSYPLSINNCIYWLLESKLAYNISPGTGHNDILEFDIIKEEFTVIPCPVPLNTKCMARQTHLLTIDGLLSFMLIGYSSIITWRLEDGADHKLWIATEYNFSTEFVDPRITSIRVAGTLGVAGVDGKVALRRNNEFLVCNLVEGMILNNNTMEMPHGCNVVYFSHQMSLASLKNCKSEIRISKDWKVWVRD